MADSALLAGADGLASNLTESSDLAALGLETINTDVIDGTALLTDSITTALTGGDTLVDTSTDDAV